MSDTSQLLAESRIAHQQAKGAHRAGNVANARELFTTALESRLKARQADPMKADPAWLADALHPAMPGEKQRRHMRMPGLTTAEVAVKVDADLESYFRVMVGETPQARQSVSDPEIVTPKAWVEIKAGSVDAEGHSPCARGHRPQLLNFTERVCLGCGRVEQLQETKALEDTDAFKQAQKEARHV